VNRKQRRVAAATGGGGPADLFRDAVKLHRAGDTARADGLYKLVLKSDPGNADALYMRGLIATARGRAQEAVDLLSAAAAAAPHKAAHHSNLGVALRAAGRHAEADACFRMAEAVAPGFAAEHLGNGLALLGQGQVEAARVFFQRAVDLDPSSVEARVAYGDSLLSARDLDGALAQAATALAMAPGHPDARRLAGTALVLLHRPHEATPHLRAALGAMPSSPGVLASLGSALLATGESDEADACFRAALGIEPGNAWAHLNRAYSLLASGQWEEGWREYEWRWKTDVMPRRVSDRPRWNGEPGGGRRLLLWSEQGFGDALQFVRYAALAAGRGWEVVVAAQAPLVRLFGGVEGVSAVCGDGAAPPPHDAHCPMLSLPGILAPDPGGLPVGPWLTADPALAAKWRARLAGLPGKRVGVVWKGSGRMIGDDRSMAAATFARMLGRRGASFVSLQKGATAEELSALSAVCDLRDAAPDLTDFAETAAAVSALDLVLTVDTAVCHLAGALGAATWALLPRVADWRWGRAATSPWYPGTRLFRCGTEGWGPTTDEVAAALSDWAA
jgi:tetratricopeptide (TPR) repeat protein